MREGEAGTTPSTPKNLRHFLLGCLTLHPGGLCCWDLGEGSCREGWLEKLEVRSEVEGREQGLESTPGLQANFLIRLVESERLL